jgi:hypothetical protein
MKRIEQENMREETMKNIWLVFILCTIGLHLTGCHHMPGAEYSSNNQGSPMDVRE